MAPSPRRPIPERPLLKPPVRPARRVRETFLVSLLFLAVFSCLYSSVITTRLLFRSSKYIDDGSPIPVLDAAVDGDYSDYVCVGWRVSADCSPDGDRDITGDRSCEFRIRHGSSGYCEVAHKTTRVRRRVLPMHCDSVSPEAAFECNGFEDLLTYGRKALAYTHDRRFSYGHNQYELLQQNNLTAAPTPLFFDRGITMVVYNELLLSAYVSIRWLRSQGSDLPLELWYRRVETDTNHPLIHELTTKYGVFLREFTDPLATGYFTKLYAVFYSAFDNVLVLDADNFAVRDPAYLFDSREFVDKGAIFWPDFWWPEHTTFNVHNTSLLWQVFDLPFVDMFEQESGQVLIDQRRHWKALNALMYYGFTLPRLPDELRLVWGDKDLFRFAWIKTTSEFHMIARPPGSAGRINAPTNTFCGLTMIQHDPLGDMLFLHRNLQKLVETNRVELWTHIQDFKRDAPQHAYRIHWAKIFDEFPSCWGQANDWNEYYTLVKVSNTSISRMESTLLEFADEGVAITQRQV